MIFLCLLLSLGKKWLQFASGRCSCFNALCNVEGENAVVFFGVAACRRGKCCCFFCFLVSCLFFSKFMQKLVCAQTTCKDVNSWKTLCCFVSRLQANIGQAWSSFIDFPHIFSKLSGISRACYQSKWAFNNFGLVQWFLPAYGWLHWWNSSQLTASKGTNSERKAREQLTASDPAKQGNQAEKQFQKFGMTNLGLGNQKNNLPNTQTHHNHHHHYHHHHHHHLLLHLDLFATTFTVTTFTFTFTTTFTVTTNTTTERTNLLGSGKVL